MPPLQQRSLSSKPKKKNGGTGLNDVFILVFGVAFFVSLSLNILHLNGAFDDADVSDVNKQRGRISRHHHHAHHTKGKGAVHSAMADFKDKSWLKKKHKERQANGVLAGEYDEKKPLNNVQLGSLDCHAYGDHVDEDAVQEMIYWQDIPQDAQWVSPFVKQQQKLLDGASSSETKYLTFEPDGGGWNNIRMAMETVFGLALAMGRTLVIPPEKTMYLLGKRDNKQKKHFSFIDFYPIDEIAKEHVGLDIISMKEYLEREAMTGRLRNKETGKVEYPPGNRTDWNGIDQKEYDMMREYLRRVTYTPMWKPGDCVPAFPASGDHKDIKLLEDLVLQAKVRTVPGKDPVPVDAPPLQRLEEVMANRKKLCIYDEEMQRAPAIHFQMNHKQNLRLLVHFYGFLFFEDWKEDLFMKRFIRDHVRYIDEIQCAAARVVAAVRKHARERNPTGNPHGVFDSFHVRRGDFQFKDTRISAEEIYENSKNELTPGTTIFIATDERDKKFFDPLKQHYDVLFLDDFVRTELEGLNTNYLGMVDQLIASRGRIFFGCWHSTFTGFIMRLRGYHSQNQREPGYEDGLLLNSYYYATQDRKLEMHEYAPLRNGFFNREFPMSWRNIDQGIDLLATAEER